MLEALATKGSDVNNNGRIIEARDKIDYFMRERYYEKARLKCEEVIQTLKKSESKILLNSFVDLSYSIRGKYLPKQEFQLGTYVNAEVEFVPRITITDNGNGLRKGDPGFTIWNDKDEEFDCYIKEMPDLKVGDMTRLWITNIKWRFHKIYLESRVERGDIIHAKIRGTSKRNEPYFRFLSYDGFVKIFDKDYEGTRKLEKGRDYKMNVIYTRKSVSKGSNEKVFRVGILFAHALEKVPGQVWKDNQDKVFRNGVGV